MLRTGSATATVLTLLISSALAHSQEVSPPTTLRPAPIMARPALKLSPAVTGSLVTPDRDLRRAALQGLRRHQRVQLRHTINLLRAGDQRAGVAAWQGFLSTVGPEQPPLDIAALVQWVVRQSYIESNEELKARADKVQFFNEQKKAVREYLADLREAQSALQKPGREAGIASPVATVREPVLAETVAARRAVTYRSNKIEVARELADEVGKWDEALSRLGDEGQLANVDMQNWLQKQQQLLTLLSSISKQLHDAAMAIIRKIGS
jgi:hypothetical protein